ncbi:exodeoxyribonuclease V subunit alpha [uncultured Psychrobacter sp.]|uniref:exodeoxyribonuclease V subunit alpha n=1 Tax=uncultured Psychrobacter sp. TaxID=259303 RepID=UPI0034597A51
MNNNQSRAAISSQKSWASTISDYILLRRQQTHQAYDGSATTANTDKENGLFIAIFTLLATHLEEGHTVLTIEIAEHEAPLQGRVNDERVTLYAWQQQLLEILAAPILTLIDTPIQMQAEDNFLEEESIDEPLLFGSLNTLFSKRESLWGQLALSNYEKERLVKRLDTVVALYQLLKNTDLTSFINSVNDHALFTDVNVGIVDNKNSLSKNNQPIIYQIQSPEDQNANNSITSLTFWLHRSWQAEFNLVKHVNNILQQKVTPLQISVPKGLHEKQVTAIDVANNNAFSIITGGPGTGKTYTVAQLVIALQQVTEGRTDEHENVKFSTDSASLALVAPTGKAAQRMQESLQAALNLANVDIQLQEAKTIHRLLGIGRTGRPRYDANNPLGEDIIIVDEASMLGVELANYLVSAVKPSARLILLGDANQLAAVDAGAVLSDLCRIPLLQSIHVQLTESRRFSADSGIGKLAYQINKAETNIATIWQLLEQDKALSFQNLNVSRTATSIDNKNSLSKNKTVLSTVIKYNNYLSEIKKLLENPIEKSVPEPTKNIITSLMKTFNEFRILCAGHNGEWGDRYINNYLTQWHLTELKLPLGQNTWFHGRPVMVLQNNYELGLFNGDIGFCLQIGDDRNQMEVFFENKKQGIAINLLNEEMIATAYAMTIHKSQGSEFDHVAITFDSTHAKLLSKELIYTAVTRAKEQVTIYSTKPTLEKAVQTPTQRYTGLALQFSNLSK